MTNWITDEHGNLIFTHEGFGVRILSPERECKLNRIQVFTPWRGVEVDVWPTGMLVAMGSTTSAFTIPWEIIAAIGSARQIVTEE